MKTYDMICTALFVVILAVCSWISVPAPIPFTMQTFGVFLTLRVLGGKKGTFTILCYILLGACGIPVFSGFTAGVGILFGNTGGYMFGFVLCGLVYLAFEKLFGSSELVKQAALVTGMALCYLFGSLWFMFLYTKSEGQTGFVAVLSWCVIPFIIPDLIKLFLARPVCSKLEKAVQKVQQGR